MTSCICTVIKDEQDYLKEWIEYNIKLGINHIFIFEDIDSCSHKNITDSYSQVTLSSIDSVLNEADKQEARELKQTKRYSSHRLYLKNMLLYMNKFYSDIYDWCFTIDVDEFIALEGNKDINEILSLYNGYDAIVLSWKCYGANGLISKPDYKEKGVIEYFTSEMKGFVRERPSCLCKTCYNIKKYRPEFFGSSHSPKDCCNYCNSNFKKSDMMPSFKNMYIKHYITKSWEEYVWKLQVRGFMWGGRRNFDFFFEVNRDLLSKKEELMSELNKEILIVMPYVRSEKQGNEIELALSSWRKFCRFNYHFVVIGDTKHIDKNRFDWVEFIDCPRVKFNKEQYTPHLDMINKFNIVSQKYKEQYKYFICTPDDVYAIKPFCLSDISKTHYHSLNLEGKKDDPVYFWKHDKWKTRQLLDKENLPHINYTTHFPKYYNFNRLKKISDEFNLYNESYVIEDLYYNSFKHEEPILDSTIRLGIWSKEIFEKEFEKAVIDQNIKFVCNSIEGWSKELEEALWKIIV